MFSVPKNYASLVLLHVNQLNCFLFLKHENLICRTCITILIVKVSFGFAGGSGSSECL